MTQFQSLGDSNFNLLNCYLQVLSTNEPRLPPLVNQSPVRPDYDRPPPLPITPTVSVVNSPQSAATTSTNITTESDLHYHSTDILELHKNDPPPSTVDELVEHIERFPDNTNHSPYAQRKLQHLSSFRKNSQTPPPLSVHRTNEDEIVMVEDHYNDSRPNTSSDTLNSEEDFSSFTSDEITNLRKSGATAI